MGCSGVVFGLVLVLFILTEAHGSKWSFPLKMKGAVGRHRDRSEATESVASSAEEDPDVPQQGDSMCLFASGKKRLRVQSINDYEESDCMADVDDSVLRMDDISDFAPLQVLCEVNGYTVPAIIDTGAQISIMSYGCAQRCRISGNIDTKYSGRAIGVGSSDILGRINGLSMKIGPISFDGKVSILRDSRVDFLIGLDFLKRFNCEVSFKENALRLIVRNKTYKIPLMHDSYREAEHLTVPHSTLGDTNYEDDYVHDMDAMMQGYSDNSDSFSDSSISSSYSNDNAYSSGGSAGGSKKDSSRQSSRRFSNSGSRGSKRDVRDDPSVADIIAGVKREAAEKEERRRQRATAPPTAAAAGGAGGAAGGAGGGVGEALFDLSGV